MQSRPDVPIEGVRSTVGRFPGVSSRALGTARSLTWRRELSVEDPLPPESRRIRYVSLTAYFMSAVHKLARQDL